VFEGGLANQLRSYANLLTVANPAVRWKVRRN